MERTVHANLHESGVPILNAKGALVGVHDLRRQLSGIEPGAAIGDLPNLTPEQRPQNLAAQPTGHKNAYLNCMSPW